MTLVSLTTGVVESHTPIIKLAICRAHAFDVFKRVHTLHEEVFEQQRDTYHIANRISRKILMF